MEYKLKKIVVPLLEWYQENKRELPTMKDLTNISEEKLLKLWEVLGYYSRARNLKKVA